MAEGYGARTEYELHLAAFHGDVNRVKEILETAKTRGPREEEKEAVNLTDVHGKLCLLKGRSGSA